MAKLFFATWGNPSLWRYAHYYMEGGDEARGFSTLNLLSKVENPDSVTIFVLDSLAAEDGGAKLCNYDHVVQTARNFASRYLCGAGADIVVLPGLMSRYWNPPKTSFEFKGELSDYRMLVLYEIFRRCLEAGRDSGQSDLELALDISHGSNYMPTFTFDAFQESAAMCSVALKKSVKIKVYQSDPYPQGPNYEKLGRNKENPCIPRDATVDPPRLRCALVASRRVYQWDLARYVGYPSESSKKLLSDMRGFPGGDIRKLIQDWCLPLLGAYRLGALVQLAVLAKAAPKGEMERIVELAINHWKNMRVVETTNNKVIVQGKTKFLEGFRILLHAIAVLKGSLRLLGVQEGACRGLEECTVTFGELNKLTTIVEGSKVVAILVDREMSKLDDKRKNMTGVWRPYSEIIGQPQGSKGDEGVEERDFIAHAGFHGDFLEGRLREGEPELRMRAEKLERTLEILRRPVLVE